MPLKASTQVESKYAGMKGVVKKSTNVRPRRLVSVATSCPSVPGPAPTRRQNRKLLRSVQFPGFSPTVSGSALLCWEVRPKAALGPPGRGQKRRFPGGGRATRRVDGGLGATPSSARQCSTLYTVPDPQAPPRRCPHLALCPRVRAPFPLVLPRQTPAPALPAEPAPPAAPTRRPSAPRASCRFAPAVPSLTLPAPLHLGVRLPAAASSSALRKRAVVTPGARAAYGLLTTQHHGSFFGQRKDMIAEKLAPSEITEELPSSQLMLMKK
ncbi:hypothetical protein H8959_001888 [Pygathrix nigripes]